MFIALLYFSRSLAPRCVSLNNEPCMIRPTLIDLNPAEVNYYSFMVSIDKCRGSCNAAYDLSTKICASSKTKDINVEMFNLTTRINEAKSNSIVQHVIQIKNGIMKHVNMSPKSITRARKVIDGILARVFVKIANI